MGDNEGLAQFGIHGGHALVYGAYIWVVGKVHLGDGVRDQAQAVVVAEGGRCPMIPRRVSGRYTFEVDVVGFNEMGLHVLPIFVVGIACCPRRHVGCEDPRLLNLVETLVYELYHCVWYLRYDDLHVKFL